MALAMMLRSTCRNTGTSLLFDTFWSNNSYNLLCVCLVFCQVHYYIMAIEVYGIPSMDDLFYLNVRR